MAAKHPREVGGILVPAASGNFRHQKSAVPEERPGNVHTVRRQRLYEGLSRLRLEETGKMAFGDSQVVRRFIQGYIEMVVLLYEDDRVVNEGVFQRSAALPAATAQPAKNTLPVVASPTDVIAVNGECFIFPFRGVGDRPLQGTAQFFIIKRFKQEIDRANPQRLLGKFDFVIPRDDDSSLNRSLFNQFKSVAVGKFNVRNQYVHVHAFEKMPSFVDGARSCRDGAADAVPGKRLYQLAQQGSLIFNHNDSLHIRILIRAVVTPFCRVNSKVASSP